MENRLHYRLIASLFEYPDAGYPGRVAQIKTFLDGEYPKAAEELGKFLEYLPADDLYYLTSLAKFDDRFVIPAAHREQAIEMMEFTGDVRGSTGFGFKGDTAKRGA